MRLILATIGNNQTVKFAVEEIIRLIKAIDNTVVLDARRYNEKDPSVKNALWVGLDGSLELSEDDHIVINVENGAGVITGSNERSVLMAAYRFMYELGCRFLYPGADGEKIPKRTLDYKDLCASVDQKPSYKHRGICIEGSVGYEHVYNTIDWLPKVGMSGFFTQFFTPGVFFRRYYSKFYEDANDRDFENEITNREIDAIMSSLIDDLEKRGLVYHAVGHGWNCAPFGFDVTGWETFEGELDEKTASILALKDGKREFSGGKPLNTNLCYSNPYVQERITDCIVEYCKENRNIDYLHFWLGDGGRNHCECEECVKKTPSDFYIDMLNLLEEKLTAAKIDTKIVFLCYADTLFAPQKESIKNPERFTFMFAPIARSFSHSYDEVDLNNLPKIAEYVRNQDMPRNTVFLSVGFLEKWQRVFKGDSFVFDYHLMWDHHTDPGYYNVAKLLHRDMVALEKIGLNGMISCQLLRSAFPTGLPQYAMAAALWNKNRSFEEVKNEYFTAAFGENAKAVDEYLSKISDLACPEFVRGKIIPGYKDFSLDELISRYSQLKDVVKEFSANYIEKFKETSIDWQYLKVHAVLVCLFADVYIAKHCGDTERVTSISEKFRAVVKENEHIIDAVCDDMYLCDDVLKKYLDRHTSAEDADKPTKPIVYEF
ncbi:MAG: DUF4838 domain-containing protein [Clostridia bacterium]|nr:DUF4838 domain-containing protein [Clostridia bacterium]